MYSFSPVSPVSQALSKHGCSSGHHMNTQSAPQTLLVLSPKLQSQMHNPIPLPQPPEFWQCSSLDWLPHSTPESCILTPSWWLYGAILPPLGLREHPGPPTPTPITTSETWWLRSQGKGEELPRAQGSGAKVLCAGLIGSCTIYPSRLVTLSLSLASLWLQAQSLATQ